MKALSIPFATVLACGSGPCAQNALGDSGINFAASQPFWENQQISQPYLGQGVGFAGQFAGQGVGFAGFASQPYFGATLGQQPVGQPWNLDASTGPFFGQQPFGLQQPFGQPFVQQPFVQQPLGHWGSLAVSPGAALDQPWGNVCCGLDASTRPFASNKPWQASGQASAPSNWQNSPSSVWTQAQAQGTQVQAQGPARLPTRPPNPSLAGRSPSEQLQITKCRSAQSCEKCRQLNCYWDSTARITNRCVALGLESTQIPVDAGQASNLGYCPTTGQQGFMGVNWLAIENSGAAVPNLEGMSDSNVQQWLSSISNYDPDATDSNYPAGTAFKELLPTAAKAYSEGKIPSTTPWISFFDSLGGYSYDGYYDSYSYDLPQSPMSFGVSAFGSFGNVPSQDSFGMAPSLFGKGSW